MKNKIVNLFSNTNLVKNQGVKYSQLLEKFLEPFVHEFKNAEFYEEIFDIGIIAWNTGNLELLLPKEELENVYNSVDLENSNTDLLKRMIDYKVSHFKNYTNFILDYELKETSGDPILSVVTQEQDVYLTGMLNEIDNENTADDFDENYINRKAIILKPAQAFIDWYTNIYPEDDIEDVMETRTYLINEDIDDVEEWLRKKFDKLFMFELESFHDNKKEWPQRRNYKMFKAWFHIDISTMIYDFEYKPVSKTY